MRDGDVVCVPVHGPAVTSDLIMELLLGHTSTSRTCTIFHFDIDPCVSACTKCCHGIFSDVMMHENHVTMYQNCHNHTYMYMIFNNMYWLL